MKNYKSKIEEILQYEQDWASCDFYAPEGESQYQEGKSFNDIKSLIREIVKEAVGVDENYLDYLCIWRNDPTINSKEVKLWHEKRNQLRSEILSNVEEALK